MLNLKHKSYTMIFRRTWQQLMLVGSLFPFIVKIVSQSKTSIEPKISKCLCSGLVSNALWIRLIYDCTLLANTIFMLLKRRISAMTMLLRYKYTSVSRILKNKSPVSRIQKLCVWGRSRFIVFKSFEHLCSTKNVKFIFTEHCLAIVNIELKYYNIQRWQCKYAYCWRLILRCLNVNLTLLN